MFQNFGKILRRYQILTFFNKLKNISGKENMINTHK